MKRIGLFLLVLCAIYSSCTKTVKVPLSYSVENAQDTTPQDVYITRNGNTYVALTVKFLGGSSTDSVTVEVKGLPNGITVSPQRASGIPTYYYKYVYSAHNIAVGTYPISLVSTSRGTPAKTFNINLVVMPDDCTALFLGALTGSNACTSRGYTYPAEGVETGTQNVISLNNLGGYGVNTNTTIYFNPQRDSLTIPEQNIGNGVILKGSGTFTLSKMTIYYSAITAPGAPAETCTATITK